MGDKSRQFFGRVKEQFGQKKTKDSGRDKELGLRNVVEEHEMKANTLPGIDHGVGKGTIQMESLAFGLIIGKHKNNDKKNISIFCDFIFMFVEFSGSRKC